MIFPKQGLSLDDADGPAVYAAFENMRDNMEIEPSTVMVGLTVQKDELLNLPLDLSI